MVTLKIIDQKEAKVAKPFQPSVSHQFYSKDFVIRLVNSEKDRDDL